MTAPPITSPKSPRATVGARLLLTAVGLLLAAAGIAFTLVLHRAYERASEPYTWTETACVIRNSTVEEVRETLSDPVQYAPSILYNYLMDDVSHESTRIRRVPGQTFKDRAQAEAIVAKYPTGQGAVCYVNPNNPDEVILMRDTRSSIYTIWFPLLFVVGGLGMVINIWWPQAKDEENAP